MRTSRPIVWVFTLAALFVGLGACSVFTSKAENVATVEAAVSEVDARDAFNRLQRLPFNEGERAEFNRAYELLLRRDAELRVMLQEQSVVDIVRKDKALAGIVYSLKSSVLKVRDLAGPYFDQLPPGDQAALRGYYQSAEAAHLAYQALRTREDRTLAAMHLITLLLRVGGVAW